MGIAGPDDPSILASFPVQMELALRWAVPEDPLGGRARARLAHARAGLGRTRRRRCAQARDACSRRRSPRPSLSRSRRRSRRRSPRRRRGRCWVGNSAKLCVVVLLCWLRGARRAAGFGCAARLERTVAQSIAFCMLRAHASREWAVNLRLGDMARPAEGARPRHKVKQSEVSVFFPLLCKVSIGQAAYGARGWLA